MVSYLFLALGLLFIFIEFFLPGAVFGFSGVTLILVSVIIFANSATSASSLIAFCLLTAALVAGIVLLALRSIRSTTSFFDASDQEGFVASTYDSSAVGKEAIVLSDLKPSGYILVDDQKLQARSASGYIVAGTRVEVIAGDEDSLVVLAKDERIKETEESKSQD